MTTPDVPIRGEVRLAGYYRVSHGLYRRDAELDGDELFLRDLEAWLLVLPEGACFTHLTAGRLLGWQLPKLPEQVPVFAAVHGNPSRPRRPGLICSRLVRPDEAGSVHGLPVDRAEEILLRAARDLGVLDLVIMIDSARRLGHVDSRRMERLLAGRRPGVRRLRLAWALSDPLAESGGESVLRLFHVAVAVPVQAQVELRNGEILLGRADLLVTGTHHVQEYDGAGHRDRDQHAADLRRDRALAGTGYERRGYTLDDLLNHAATCMHELDRALERTHDPTRLARWHRWVEDSLYSEVARRRVMNRWRRVTWVDGTAPAA